MSLPVAHGQLLVLFRDIPGMSHGIRFMAIADSTGLIYNYRRFYWSIGSVGSEFLA